MSFFGILVVKALPRFHETRPPPKKKNFFPPRVDAIPSFSSWSSLLGFVVYARLTGMLSGTTQDGFPLFQKHKMFLNAWRGRFPCQEPKILT